MLLLSKRLYVKCTLSLLMIDAEPTLLMKVELVTSISSPTVDKRPTRVNLCRFRMRGVLLDLVVKHESKRQLKR